LRFFLSKKILQISFDFDNRFRVRDKILHKKFLLANLGEAAQNPKEKKPCKNTFSQLNLETP